MSGTQVRSETAIETPRARTVDMKLEIVVIPVSDVDRAKRFYGGLGWRLDADFASGDDWRVIQFTPPGSGCSVIFGKNVTAAAPGSAKGLYLIVSDIMAARNELLARGVEISEVFHGAGDVHSGTDEPYLSGRLRRQRSGSRASQLRLVRLVQTIRTATAGCSKKSRTVCPDAWTPTPRHSPRRPSSPPRSDVRQPRTESTRREPAASTMRTGRTGTPSTSSGSRPASSRRNKQRRRSRRRTLCSLQVTAWLPANDPAARMESLASARRRTFRLGVREDVVRRCRKGTRAIILQLASNPNVERAP